MLLSSERRRADHFAMPLSAADVRRANFTAAVDAAGGVERFSDRYDMNPDYVRQLLRGGGPNSSGRNIGQRAARKIEAKLGMPENALDQLQAGAAGVPKKRAPVAESRVEDDIDAIRYALGALVTGLALTQPVEAAAVESALRKAPPEFLDRGLIPKLLEALAAARKAAKPRGSVPPP